MSAPTSLPDRRTSYLMELEYREAETQAQEGRAAA